MEEVIFNEYQVGDFMTSRLGQIFPKILKFSFSQSSVKHVVRRNFEYMPQLKEIHLNFNLIADMLHDLFYSLPNLEVLDINHNEIIQISSDLLFNNQKLKYFDASNNHIDAIDASFFRTNQQLEIVKLAGNLIHSVDVDFTLLEHLMVVDVTDNMEFCNFDLIVEERANDHEKLIGWLEFQQKIDELCRIDVL